MALRSGPTEQCLRSGMPSLGEAPSGGAKALWLLSRFSKVTRRQGGTISRRYRSNGYTPELQTCQVFPKPNAPQPTLIIFITICRLNTIPLPSTPLDSRPLRFLADRTLPTNLPIIANKKPLRTQEQK